MGTHGVDVNRNHQRANGSPSKVGLSGADWRQSVAQGSLVKASGMAQASGGAGHLQAPLLHDVHSTQQLFLQLNKDQENSGKKRLQPTQTTSKENSVDATAPKRNKMACATSTANKGNCFRPFL